MSKIDRYGTDSYEKGRNDNPSQVLPGMSLGAIIMIVVAAVSPAETLPKIHPAMAQERIAKDLSTPITKA